MISPVQTVEITGAELIRALDSFRSGLEASSVQAQFVDVVVEFLRGREGYSYDCTGIMRLAMSIGAHLRAGEEPRGGLSSHPFAGDSEALNEVKIVDWAPALREINPRFGEAFEKSLGLDARTAT